MNMREIVDGMVHSFFVILGGSVIAAFLFLVICRPGTLIHIHDLGALIVLAITSDMSYCIFYSKKELSRTQLLVRYIIHLVYILSEMLFAAYYMNWIDTGKPLQTIVFAGLVVAVYIMVTMISLIHAKKTADKLNEKLKERYNR
jgi:uncharacterized membrane protein (DUF485 family)